MPIIYPIKDKKPVIGSNTFIAPNATIVGDVTIGDDCSVWFNAVIRGDVHFIKIGNNVNIQDGAIIHCTYKKSPVTIHNRVSIAHNAVVHGCTIHSNVLVGIGAIILDDAVIESNTIIAAGAVVLEKTVVKEGYIYAGVPAKPVKKIDDNLLKNTINRITDSYTMYASWHDENIYSNYSDS